MGYTRPPLLDSQWSLQWRDVSYTDTNGFFIPLLVCTLVDSTMVAQRTIAPIEGPEESMDGIVAVDPYLWA